jgi:hypothetical protein
MIISLSISAQQLISIESVHIFIRYLLEYKISKLSSSDILFVAVILKRNIYFAQLQNFVALLYTTPVKIPIRIWHNNRVFIGVGNKVKIVNIE